MMRRATPLPALALLVLPMAASAQVTPIVDSPASRASAAQGVSVVAINEGETPQHFTPPATIDAVARDGTPIRLVRDPATPYADIAPHGFARLRYRLAEDTAPAPSVVAATVSGSSAATAQVSPSEQPTISANGSSSAFLDRLYAYEPIYGVWGPGSTGAKLQFSFAARPIGGTGVLSHLRFAYTQQIFWRVNDLSGPVRSLTYSPELFYEAPIGATSQIAAGYRHDSNGGDVSDSVDLNRLYVKVNKRIALGHGWQLNVTPQLWYDLFHHGIAPDIDDYWGYAAIKTSIEQQDGIKLSVYARGNPATGKGATELFLSYPVRRFGTGDVGIYLFGQLFAGYGEQLRDYNVDTTRARIGISFTR